MSEPCLNNGDCINHSGGYECHCLPEFSGTYCEVNERQRQCDSNTCSPYGDCVDIGNGNTIGCVCKPEYPGNYPNCSMDSICANTNPCKNGATCSLWKNTFNCTCLPGYAGKIIIIIIIFLNFLTNNLILKQMFVFALYISNILLLLAVIFLHFFRLKGSACELTAFVKCKLVVCYYYKAGGKCVNVSCVVCSNEWTDSSYFDGKQIKCTNSLPYCVHVVVCNGYVTVSNIN